MLGSWQGVMGEKRLRTLVTAKSRSLKKSAQKRFEKILVSQS